MRKTRLVLNLIALLLFVQPAFSQKEIFVGKFVGADLSVTLSKKGNGYSGFAISEGQRLELTVQKINTNTIEGTYSLLELPIPFQAQIQGNSMTLVSAGEVFQLQRQSVAMQKPAYPPKALKTLAKSNSKIKFGKDDIGDKYLGFKFKTPAGWKAQKAEQGYLLGSNTEKGFIMVLLHQYQTLDQLRQEAQVGLQEEGGTSMFLDGQLIAFGKNGLAGKFKGTMEWQQATAYVVSVLSPHGGGLSIMTAVETASYNDSYKKRAEELTRSIVFFKPEQLPVNEEWKQTLSGARLTYMWSYYSGGSGGSYAGGSQKTIIDLCGQGYFRYSDNNQMAVDGGFGTGYNASGYSGGNNQGNGTWEVVTRGNQPLLRLKFYDGRLHEYVLSYRDKKTYLDDKRFFRTYANNAVVEHRPQCF